MMKKNIMPVTISAKKLLAIPQSVIACPVPCCKKMTKNAVNTIATGLNFASQETSIAVNPMPPTVSALTV